MVKFYLVARGIAISAFGSFFINLCVFSKRGAEMTMNKCSNQSTIIDFSDNGSWHGYQYLFLLVFLLIRYSLMGVWLYFINTTENDDIRKELWWNKRRRLFPIMVWINLFTFYPPSDSFLNGNRALRGDQRNGNSPKRDYCGTRFYLFFFVYYVVIYLRFSTYFDAYMYIH